MRAIGNDNNYDSVPIDNIPNLNRPDSNNEGVDLESLRDQIYAKTGRYISPDTPEAELRAEVEALQEENTEESPVSSGNSGNSSNVFALAAGTTLTATASDPEVSDSEIEGTNDIPEIKDIPEDLKLLLSIQSSMMLIKATGNQELIDKANSISNDSSLSREEKSKQLEDIVRSISGVTLKSPEEWPELNIMINETMDSIRLAGNQELMDKANSINNESSFSNLDKLNLLTNLLHDYYKNSNL